MIFSKWEQGKVQELFCRNSKHKLGSNLHHIHPNYIFIKTCHVGIKAIESFTTDNDMNVEIQYKITFHFFLKALNSTSQHSTYFQIPPFVFCGYKTWVDKYSLYLCVEFIKTMSVWCYSNKLFKKCM